MCFWRLIDTTPVGRRQYIRFVEKNCTSIRWDYVAYVFLGALVFAAVAIFLSSFGITALYSRYKKSKAEKEELEKNEKIE